MYHAFRLEYGDDLVEGIDKYVKENSIKAASIISGVGCVYELRIRLADGKSIKTIKDNYEIVSLMGTISQDGAHLHISFSDIEGKVIGGHLLKGTLINTTAEICLVEFDNLDFKREHDENTGYDELVINKIEH
ncbi:MAG: DNA-binding protein [Erysipelotrichales bacterium]